MFLKEVSYAHQGCLYLMKNSYYYHHDTSGLSDKSSKAFILSFCNNVKVFIVTFNHFEAPSAELKLLYNIMKMMNFFNKKTWLFEQPLFVWAGYSEARRFSQTLILELQSQHL